MQVIYFFFHCLTAGEDYFLLQRVGLRHKRCLYQTSTKRGTFVFVSTTCSYDNENSLWIWTNNGQLLNWKTLECMTDDLLFQQKHFVTMKKCDRHNRKQLWECVSHNNDYIKRTESGRYMYYGGYFDYVTTRDTHWSVARKWMRRGSRNNVCSQGSLILNPINKLRINYKTHLIQTLVTECFDILVPNALTVFPGQLWPNYRSCLPQPPIGICRIGDFNCIRFCA